MGGERWVRSRLACEPQTCLSPLISPLSKHKTKYPGGIRKAPPQGCLPKPRLWLQGSPAPIRPQWLVGTGQPQATTAAHGNHWTRLITLTIKCAVLRDGAALQPEAEAAWGGLCKPRFMGKKKRSLRFGFETRLMWFFRSAVDPTAPFPLAGLLGAQLFQKLTLFVWDPKKGWVTGSFRSTQVI